jgi:hypothetical protein
MEKIRYDINNELRRTQYELMLLEFVRVRISSLLRYIFSNSLAIFVNPAHPRRGTRMTRIARIFTDIFNPLASVFHPLNNKPQRAQRTQSRIANLCALCVLCGELTLFPANDEKTNSKGRTRMTRIYTYPCVSASSAQSVFHSLPSALTYVHPRLILSMLEKTAEFYHTSINKANTIFYQKSDLNDRHFLLQRA